MKSKPVFLTKSRLVEKGVLTFKLSPTSGHIISKESLDSHMIFSERGQLFRVSKVISDFQPVLFELVDLQDTPVQGRFYRKQLTKSPAPKDEDYFFIEKILRSKTVKGKKIHLVKYLYYPNKFNKWIAEDDMISKN